VEKSQSHGGAAALGQGEVGAVSPGFLPLTISETNNI